MLFRKTTYYLFFLLFQFVSAQNIVIQEYTNKNHLESNEILKIFKDSRQYLWVSTQNGLYIQNMEHFKRLNYFNEFNFLNVYDILEDKQNNMWFASYGDGVVFFDGIFIRQFKVKDGLLSDRNLKILEDDANVYIGGLKGISIINKTTKNIQKAQFNHPNSEILEVNNLFRIGNHIFATTAYNGIFRLNGNKLELFNHFNPIVTAYFYKNDVVITSNNGVYIYKSENFINNLSYSKKINIPIIWDYVLVDNNKYWMLTSDLVNSKGLVYEYDNIKDTNTRILTDINLNVEYPRGIVYDKVNNVVYISSQDSGLKRLLLNMPYDFHPVDNQGVNGIISLDNLDYLITKNEFYIRQGKNTVYKTSVNQFYKYFEKYKSKYKLYYETHPDFFKINFNQDEKNVKFYHLKYHQNHFWIGSNIGLFKLDKKGNIINMYPLHAYNFEFSGNFLIDSHPFKGIKIFTDLERFQYTYYDNSKPSVPSYIVCMDKIGETVFFASSIYGLYKYENGKFYSYLENGKFKEAKIKIIKSLPNNRLMLSTEFGDVYVLKVKDDDLIVERKITKDQINSDNILLLNEFNGKLIIGTYNTLVIIKNDKFYYFDNTQGFTYKKITTSSISNNQLLVGVDYGYFSFDIEKISQYTGRTHPLIITGLKINNKRLPREDFKWFNLLNRNLDLSSSENNIYIDFSLVNPKYPEKYKFRYRLNKNGKWSEYFNENYIQLNSMKYGKYSIDLEIVDLNGNRRDYVHLIDVKINPPFYLNKFFIALNIFIIGLILYTFYRLKINNIKDINEIKIQQIELENKAYNKQISLEKKISEVKLMALQSQMNPHFIFNILNSIQYYIIDQDTENALNILDKFARLIRKMLDLSRHQSIPLVTKIEFLKLYVEIENSRYKNKVQFLVHVDPIIDIHNTFIPPMLLQPLVENAFIHAFDPRNEDNQLKLNVSMNEEFYIFEIIDNGKGLNTEVKKDVNHQSKGLKIIRERLSILNNNYNEEFLVFSKGNPGTIVRLYLKKDNY